jgi:orotate phosphoribosyltransferase
LEALEVAVASGLEVVQAIALVDRSGGLVEERLAGTDVRYQALADPRALGVDE